MTRDRGEIRLQQRGSEVCLTFVTNNQQRADALFEEMARQLEDGELQITVTGITGELH